MCAVDIKQNMLIKNCKKIDTCWWGKVGRWMPLPVKMDALVIAVDSERYRIQCRVCWCKIGSEHSTIVRHHMFISSTAVSFLRCVWERECCYVVNQPASDGHSGTGLLVPVAAGARTTFASCRLEQLELVSDFPALCMSISAMLPETHPKYLNTSFIPFYLCTSSTKEFIFVCFCSFDLFFSWVVRLISIFFSWQEHHWFYSQRKSNPQDWQPPPINSEFARSWLERLMCVCLFSCYLSFCVCVCV